MVEGRPELPAKPGRRDGGPAGKLIRWDAQHGANFASDREFALAGDQGFVDHLASRPIIGEEAEEYHAAFLRLSRDRPHTVLGGGMGPPIKEPNPIPLPLIRAEGERLRFEGQELEYFIEILAEIDGIFLELRMKQILDETSRMMADLKRRRP